MILANIVADVLIAMAEYLPRWLAVDGHLILSGIIDTRAEEVADKLREAGLVIAETRSAEGWFAYTCHF